MKRGNSSKKCSVDFKRFVWKKKDFDPFHSFRISLLLLSKASNMLPEKDTRIESSALGTLSCSLPII